jgi:hypothetical protein
VDSIFKWKNITQKKKNTPPEKKFRHYKEYLIVKGYMHKRNPKLDALYRLVTIHLFTTPDTFINKLKSIDNEYL